MRFTLEQRTDVNVVTRAGPDGIRIGELLIRRSVILSATELVQDWPVSSLRDVDIGALEPALQLAPEILVLGTGGRLQFPPTPLYAELAGRGIGLEVMDTLAACRTYNILVHEDRPVVAALILP